MLNRILQSLVYLGILFPAISTPQQLLRINRDRMCSWNEDVIIPDELYRFPPDEQTQKFVNNIMKYAGLDANFELIAANVPNAVATMENGKRLILYNQLFMKDVAKQTSTNWSAVSILAHEIGHHLNGHTLLGSGNVKSENELAADKFSGDILFKMGASLDQARAAMESRPETKSANYPKKSVRLIAIGNGWISAQELAASKQAAPSPSTLDNAPKPQYDRAAEEQRKAAEQARQDRERRETEEAERDRRAQEKEEREARAEERKERAAKRASSRGCYAWGRRFCSLEPDLPIGGPCYCYGVSGVGIIGNP